MRAWTSAANVSSLALMAFSDSAICARDSASLGSGCVEGPCPLFTCVSLAIGVDKRKCSLYAVPDRRNRSPGRCWLGRTEPAAQGFAAAGVDFNVGEVVATGGATVDDYNAHVLVACSLDEA